MAGELSYHARVSVILLILYLYQTISLELLTGARHLLVMPICGLVNHKVHNIVPALNVNDKHGIIRSSHTVSCQSLHVISFVANDRSLSMWMHEILPCQMSARWTPNATSSQSTVSSSTMLHSTTTTPSTTSSWCSVPAFVMPCCLTWAWPRPTASE
jgi:hypothetical protein